MGYSPWGRQESDTTEHTHTLHYCVPGRTRNYSVLLDVSLVVKAQLWAQGYKILKSQDL